MQPLQPSKKHYTYHINFKIRNFNVEFQIFVHGVNVIENIANDSWNDALVFRVADDTLKTFKIQKETRKKKTHTSIVKVLPLDVWP